MTYQQAEILNAKMAIAQNQILLDAIELEHQAHELNMQAKSLRQQCSLLDKERHSIWTMDFDRDTEEF